MQSKSGTARRGRPCKEGSQQQRGGVWGKTLILNPRPTLVVAGGLGGNVGVHAAVVGVLDVQLGALAPPEGGLRQPVKVQVRLARVPLPGDSHVVPVAVSPAPKAESA